MKILYINSVCDFGSTGKLVRELANSDRYDSLICYGRKSPSINYNCVRVTRRYEVLLAMFNMIVFGNSMDNCRHATKYLIKTIDNYKPDIIHLHNLHGFYLNIPMLFNYLKKKNIPVVWTLHDCWIFTGYCAHFDFAKCSQFKDECIKCKHNFSYPFSIFKQRVRKEYHLKKELFNQINNLTIVTPSKWLKNQVKGSFLANQKTFVINNGINFNQSLDEGKFEQFTVLFVANYWTEEKGISEIKKIVPLLKKEIRIILIGKTKNVIGLERCEIIGRTSSKEELIYYYKKSHIFVNPTLEDNFPTVNIESLACGTPVVTYESGGSPEIIDKTSGIVVEKYDFQKLVEIINNQYEKYTFNSEDCVKRSKLFTEKRMLDAYFNLYGDILKGNNLEE